MGMFLRRGYAQRGTRASDLEIGQTIKLNVNGKAWDWLVVHQGLPSSIYDASCDGTWLLMKDIYKNQKWNSTDSNVLETSTIQAYLNGDFLNLFDGNIKDAIKQVKIPYRKNGGSYGADQSGANGLLCKIFLLSGYEVGFTKNDDIYFPLDGAKLSYFEAGTGTSADNKRIAYQNGSATYWWLRSPNASDNDSVHAISRMGRASVNKARFSSGVRPAFVLPSDFIVSKEMLAA